MSRFRGRRKPLASQRLANVERWRDCHYRQPGSRRRWRQQLGDRAVDGNSFTTVRQQNGYHGGATPQEMICPLVILMDKSSTYSGLFPCEYPKPDWWSPHPLASTPVERTIRQSSSRDRSEPPTLFDDSSRTRNRCERRGRNREVGAARRRRLAGSNSLLASQAYKDQKDFVRRHAPDDDTRSSSVLWPWISSGGIMTPVAFRKVDRCSAGTTRRLDRSDAAGAECGWL